MFINLLCSNPIHSNPIQSKQEFFEKSEELETVNFKILIVAWTKLGFSRFSKLINNNFNNVYGMIYKKKRRGGNLIKW